MDGLPPENKKLVEELIPSQISVTGTQRVLQTLLSERVSIRDLPAILEGIAEAVGHTKNALYITEHVRARLPKIYSRELVDVIFEQPYCRIANLVETDIAERQAASRYLKDLVELGVLREMQYGKEKLSIHPKLLQLLARDSNAFAPYA